VRDCAQQLPGRPAPPTARAAVSTARAVVAAVRCVPALQPLTSERTGPAALLGELPRNALACSTLASRHSGAALALRCDALPARCLAPASRAAEPGCESTGAGALEGASVWLPSSECEPEQLSPPAGDGSGQHASSESSSAVPSSQPLASPDGSSTSTSNCSKRRKGDSTSCGEGAPLFGCVRGPDAPCNVLDADLKSSSGTPGTRLAAVGCVMGRLGLSSSGESSGSCSGSSHSAAGGRSGSDAHAPAASSARSIVRSPSSARRSRAASAAYSASSASIWAPRSPGGRSGTRSGAAEGDVDPLTGSCCSPGGCIAAERQGSGSGARAAQAPIAARHLQHAHCDASAALGGAERCWWRERRSHAHQRLRGTAAESRVVGGRARLRRELAHASSHRGPA